MTGATTTEMRCRRRPDGEISDTEDIAMCIEVVVVIVRNIGLGIAPHINQIAFISSGELVDNGLQKFQKYHADTPTMASAAATPSPIWTNPLTTISSLTP
jgi:hypothetical protein